MDYYTADFETTTDPDDCRVWAWGICDIYDNDDITYGNTIDTFFTWCKHHTGAQLYFHNLAFDGAFIMDYLLSNGWKWVEDKDDVVPNSFRTVISDMNAVYAITIYFASKKYVKIYDSLKIVPLSIEQMAKAYKLPVLKGELNYDDYREVGHKLTEVEKAYLHNDITIAAMVMRVFLDTGLNKMTAGSNALADYKKMVGGQNKFRKMYPTITPTVDTFIRRAYRGGFTYVNPKYQDKVVNDGIVLDVNSLYPSVMAACDGQYLPYGEPVWFDGEPNPDDKYPLWVAMLTCKFTVKPDHIPTIQLKGNFRFVGTEYIRDSEGEVTFTVSSVDWELITAHYDIEYLQWHGGFKFKANPFQFKNYVDKWVKVKNQATIEGNSGQRQVAKLMLNSLYGKFATRLQRMSRRPELHDGRVLYIDNEETLCEGVYLPVGVFVTAYARYKTITSAQQVYDRFIYADTDSLHLVGTELPENLDIDPVRLGAWKHESTFTHGKFLRAKTYVEEEDGKLTVHVAGMPARCHAQVTLDNFGFGAVYEGKLYQKRVKGGIVLVEDTIEIRK